MKKIMIGTALLALVSIIPIPAMARVDVSINIGLPPPIVFAAPPELVVLPDTYIYVDPYIDVDLFFWNGWWWRLWEGRWYRSHYYDRGWGYYHSVPSFYYDVDPHWRGHYRDHNWYGHRWDYRPVPYNQVQRNWRNWEKNRYWEKSQRTWGVQGYQPRSHQERQGLRQQRQQQYYQRPDVRQNQPQRRERQEQQQRQPQVQPPRQQPPERVQHPQGQQQHPHGESQHQQFRGRPEGGDTEHRR